MFPETIMDKFYDIMINQCYWFDESTRGETLYCLSVDFVTKITKLQLNTMTLQGSF